MFGDIEVTICGQPTKETDWTISKVQIQARSGRSAKRTLWHCFFQSWPDFGVPQDPRSLVKFVRRVRELLPPSPAPTPPIVVHCSAGVGRTGTFIAVDILLQVN